MGHEGCDCIDDEEGAQEYCHVPEHRQDEKYAIGYVVGKMMSRLVHIDEENGGAGALDTICHGLRYFRHVLLVCLFFGDADRQSIIEGRATQPGQGFGCDVGIHRVGKAKGKAGHIVHVASKAQLAELAVAQLDGNLVSYLIAQRHGRCVYNDLFFAQRRECRFAQGRLELVEPGVLWVLQCCELDRYLTIVASDDLGIGRSPPFHSVDAWHLAGDL